MGALLAPKLLAAATAIYASVVQLPHAGVSFGQAHNVLVKSLAIVALFDVICAWIFFAANGSVVVLNVPR
ncbi:hypothetical protein LguiB_016507 [Lonicera macranthoides]